ncbi:MAG TPA: AsmA family protein [Burkholderiales bacterium]|nr:AsmA family protein [Burkholderiales bacterium]
MRFFKWTAGLFLVFAAIAFVVVFFTGFNLLRGPITRMVSEKTGRELRIEGDLRPVWSWIYPRVRAEGVSFANPKWAKQKYLLQADAVEASISVLPLFAGRFVIPDVVLSRPKVALEEDAQGRKSWILDPDKPKRESRVFIRRLALDRGVLAYDNARRDTHLRAELSTDARGTAFTVKGKYNGLALSGAGRGGEVLALRENDERPFPVKGEASIGSTRVRLDGRITELVGLAGLDTAIELSGKSLSELYTIVGVAFPSTSAYSTSGRLIRDDHFVRYENFTGKVGESDVSGTFQVDTAGKRPMMRGDIVSKVLNLADLGPVVGTRKTEKGGVLPDAPFDPKRWSSVDADVKLTAGTLRRPKQLPLENLSTRIRMQDAVLTLDPLEFGVAGGKLAGTLRLDGRGGAIKARADLSARKLELGRLFPTIKVARASVGEMSGAIELSGTGNSVARMLGSSSGKIGLFVDSGQVSELLMDFAATDLWGIAKTALKGDEPVKIRCIVGDFGVKDGLMSTNALVFDTAVVNITGSGKINLKDERLDLTLHPDPKGGSLAALRAPLHLRGSFSDPNLAVDKKTVAAKGLGAAVMALINPLLAVIPLIDAGPGKDSNCGKLIAQLSQESRSAARSNGSASAVGSSRPPAR